MKILECWPPFSKKEIVIGNVNASVAICTLWTPKDVFIKKYFGGSIGDNVAVLGNLYSVFGIGILIRNLLSNTSIRYLIVSGVDKGKGKKVLLNEINDNPLLAKDLFLEPCHIERFLEQVKIIPVDADKVKRFVEEKSYRDDSFENKKFEPILIPVPEPTNEIFPGLRTGSHIRARTIKEAYSYILKEIRFFGEFTAPDSEGHTRQELQNLSVVITEQDPSDFSSIPHPEYDESYIVKYCEDFWVGKKPGDLAYTYGSTIRHKFGDQVEALVDAFKKKYETFRTVVSLWDPNIESGSIKAEDPPCLVMIQARLTGNILTLWARIRTNDMFGGWSLNAAALRYFQFMLLKRLRIELKSSGLEMGELEVSSGSAHIYDRDFVNVDKYIRDVRKNWKFFPDSKGNFEVKVDDDGIVVNLYSPEGFLLKTFHGKSAEGLSKKIKPFMSDISNALYVGRELSRAERRK